MEYSKKTLIAKDWILKLANGINPLDGSTIKDDDVVNNVHISRCLFYVAKILDSANYEISKENPLQGNRGRKRKRECVEPLDLKGVDVCKLCSCDQITISNFVKAINGSIPENMQPITCREILNWLLANGYLEEICFDSGKKIRRPTQKGLSKGISTETRSGSGGEYVAVVYSMYAQRFILDNITDMIRD